MIILRVLRNPPVHVYGVHGGSKRTSFLAPNVGRYLATLTLSYFPPDIHKTSERLTAGPKHVSATLGVIRPASVIGTRRTLLALAHD